MVLLIANAFPIFRKKNGTRPKAFSDLKSQKIPYKENLQKNIRISKNHTNINVFEFHYTS